LAKAKARVFISRQALASSSVEVAFSAPLSFEESDMLTPFGTEVRREELASIAQSSIKGLRPRPFQ